VRDRPDHSSRPSEVLVHFDPVRQSFTRTNVISAGRFGIVLGAIVYSARRSSRRDRQCAHRSGSLKSNCGEGCPKAHFRCQAANHLPSPQAIRNTWPSMQEDSHPSKFNGNSDTRKFVRRNSVTDAGRCTQGICRANRGNRAARTAIWAPSKLVPFTSKQILKIPSGSQRQGRNR
jgi:hypothetical protein